LPVTSAPSAFTVLFLQNKIKAKGEFSERLVNYCIRYRQYWISKGFRTPLTDALIFSKMRAAVGGNLRVMLSGGAPLAEDAQRFIRTTLTTPLLQGYGLTETTSTACISDPDDLTVGHVGPPLNGVSLKLVDWKEGGYTVDDEDGPRGEIVIGGNHVSQGYYNMPEKTKEDFFQEGGLQYFRTGDIGQLVGDNCAVKIIDRKKDLLKLQAGEYVSLGKVESNIKINPLLDNICVYGSSQANYGMLLLMNPPDHVVHLPEFFLQW
jgi:long-chain acyl-CoA synthetase